MIVVSTKKDYNANKKELIEKEKENLAYTIQAQTIKKEVLCESIFKFIRVSYLTISNEELEKVDEYFNVFKKSLELVNDNLELMNNLQKNLDEFSEKADDYKKVEEYNKKWIEANEAILKNTVQIENGLKYIYVSSDLSVEEKEKKTKIENLEEINVKEEIVQIEEGLIEEFNLEEHPENTLIISESNGKVVLPFTIKEIAEIYNENKEKYSKIEEIVEEKFTLNIKDYKNAAVARFKETYKLMRNKENASRIKAFAVSSELFFNYNLHPAIISASKSLDELDIYLDYLEENQIHKFDCFKIIFDIPPAKLNSEG